MSKIVIDGSAQAGATVSLYDGATAIGSGVATTTGAFSILSNSALSNGTHLLTATAANSAGASQASAPLSVFIDTQPATAALSHLTETSTSTGMTLNLSGTSADAVAGVAYTVTVLQDGAKVGTVTPGANGAWSFSQSNVSNAIHTYTLQTTDAAANTGASSNDLILGTSGRDTIVGGPGNNLIFGGAGADTLTGGSGQNTFVYNSTSDAPYGKHPGVETITNWATGLDLLDLSGLGHLTFGGQTQNVSPYSLEWYVSGGNTFIVGDAQGHARPDFMIELMGVHALSSSDFHLA